MKGFTCDRCGAFDPGQESQRDGMYISAGWATVNGLGHARHLCPPCAKDVTSYVDNQNNKGKK